MLQPKRWWIGLPLLAGLVYFASDSLTRTVETDLSGKIGARLSQSGIDNARVEARGRDVTINGLALSEDEKNKAFTAVRQEEGLRSLADKTQAVGVAQPYLLSIESKGAAATMSGYASPGGEREKLRALLANASFEVIDDTRYATGAPPHLVEAVAAGAQALKRLSAGKLAFVGSDISLDGEAPYEKAAVDIEHRFLAAVPPGFRVVTHLKAPVVGSALEPARCQSAFAELLSKRRILFADKNARILDESAPLMDALTVVALRCQNESIEVSGHTEQFGIEEINRELAKQRAQAVIDWLVAAGVDAAKLTAVGYGSERPIAPSDNDESRALNRRIEFAVK